MMRKKWMAAALLLSALSILTSCGKKNITIADLKNVEVEKYVTLPDYKNLEVTVPEKMEITDEYVKSYISNRINEVSKLHELTGTVENGDVVNIDYAGTIDGTAFEGGTAKGQLLEIGSGSFIDGFEAGLVGASVGETKELSLKFPDNYGGSAELAGQACVFAVKINYILAELTDENVNLVDDGYQSASEYREDAKKMLVEYTDYQHKMQAESYIATSLMADCTYQKLPESLVKDYEENLRSDFEDAAAAEGVTLEQYMANNYQTTADNMADTLTSIAERCAREGLAVQAIANQEGFAVSDEEVDAAIAEYVAAAENGEEPDKENVRMNLLYGKVYDFLIGVYEG